MTTRYPWDEFSPVWIHANESTVKQHSSYRAAKSGDPDAAYLLVDALLNPIIDEQLADTFALQKPILVSAHAVEGSGVNAIPEALADILAQQLGWPTDYGMVQINIVAHTGADGFSRLARQAKFDGDAKAGKPRSAKMTLDEATYKQLRLKHGQRLENWWDQRFGFRFDCLTESEARYLLNTSDVDRIRNKIIAAVQG